MKRRTRRETEAFSLSFLDCICCGFGAVILLFVISLGSERLSIMHLRDTLMKIFQQRMTESEILETRRERVVIKVEAQEKSMTDLKDKIAGLEAEIEEIQNRISVAEFGKEKLVTEIEETGVAIDAREKEVPAIEQKDPTLPIGLGVESNYLIFVMDTSGSMRNPNSIQIWPIVLNKIRETLDSYPIVKGIQFLDANGNYIVKGTKGQWIRDSKQTRDGFFRGIRQYGFHSESNPVPGIVKAITTFSDPADPDKKIGIYVFGDEFIQTADPVLRRLERINPRDSTTGKRPVTINAIGFPHVVKFERHFTKTGLKFANLMREVTREHDGAFIGIEN